MLTKTRSLTLPVHLASPPTLTEFDFVTAANTLGGGVEVAGIMAVAQVEAGGRPRVGIELPMPEALKPLLLQAKAKSACFLMIDAKKLANSKQTSFHFSTKGK